ncbi:type IV toxin-antitoxin system AbiEi family antitoxin domain-containing protein [bacterium]|nr:type IV toxin-antitoxin system AbiEi family antitoxin domain-containing protein [bacterium]
MKALSGIGKLDRQRLAEIIRGTKGSVSVAEAAGILNISMTEVAKMLSRWAKKGWLSRIRRGIYVPVPLESRTSDTSLEDPWIIAQRLFAPCYIGGWSAMEYWGLTEQIFRDILIMTTQKPRERNIVIKGTKFILHTIPEKDIFGVSPIWREQIKVSVSDPARTILDMLTDPQLGGGIRFTMDIFTNYLKSDKRNITMLMEYAKRLDNGAVFKRLGYLLEKLSPEEKGAIELCRLKITQGNAKLDPSIKSDRLVTRWRLWIPAGWSKENKGD